METGQGLEFRPPPAAGRGTCGSQPPNLPMVFAPAAWHSSPGWSPGYFLYLSSRHFGSCGGFSSAFGIPLKEKAK